MHPYPNNNPYHHYPLLPQPLAQRLYQSVPAAPTISYTIPAPILRSQLGPSMLHRPAPVSYKNVYGPPPVNVYGPPPPYHPSYTNLPSQRPNSNYNDNHNHHHHHNPQNRPQPKDVVEFDDFCIDKKANSYKMPTPHYKVVNDIPLPIPPLSASGKCQQLRVK